MKVKMVDGSENYKENVFKVIFMPFTVCNYHCPYCFERNRSSTSKIDRKKLDSFFNNFDNMVLNYIEQTEWKGEFNRLRKNLNLIGGEISLIPIDEMLDYLDRVKNLTIVKLTSNFSANIEWYKKFTEYCYKRQIECAILISYHPTEISEKDFINKLIEYDKFLSDMIEKYSSKYVLDTVIKMVISSNQDMKRIFDIKEKYKNSLNHMHFKHNIDIESFKNVDKELLNKIKEINEYEKDYLKHKTKVFLENGDVIEYLNPKIIPLHYDTTSNNDKYLCEYSLNFIFIDEDGEIKQNCSMSQKSYGNIFKNEYNFVKRDSVICNVHRCKHIGKFDNLSGSKIVIL